MKKLDEVAMNFYELRDPWYSTDQAGSAANPIEQIDELSMPGIICSQCGSQWAGSRRLYIPVTDPGLEPTMLGYPLPEKEWRRFDQEVHERLGLPPDLILMPGDRLGIPHYEVKRPKLHDFLHPYPGTLVVKPSVVAALQEAGMTGFESIRNETSWAAKMKNSPIGPPELYTLRITGTAWHPGVTPKSILVCDHCRRSKPPILDWHIVDETRWNGSDFMNVDDNPNRVIVTEQVCALLTEKGFTNWICD